MKLSKKKRKMNDINLDGMFRLILLIYGKNNMKKYVSKFMQNQLRNSMTKKQIFVTCSEN